MLFQQLEDEEYWPSKLQLLPVKNLNDLCLEESMLPKKTSTFTKHNRVQTLKEFI